MGKKILLITPPYHCGVVESAGRWANLGFLYIAGELLKDGHEVEIYDAMARDHTYEDIKKHITESRPEIVGSTAYTATIRDATRVLALAKSIDPGITTIIGGIHPTMMPEETLQDSNGAIDYVVRWEGEHTAPELMRALEGCIKKTAVKGIAYREDGKIIITPQRKFIADLDALTPAWDLLHWEDYYLSFLEDTRVALVSSSRGCENSCSFCSQQKFWQQTYRARSAKNFVGEIEHLHHRFGVNAFFIADEYPTCNAGRWEEILDLLIKKNLGVYLLAETRAGDIVRDRSILYKYRRAGIIHMFIGVESADQGTLDRFKKSQTCRECREAIRLLNEHHIITECSFILGLPEETPQSIETTLALAHHYDADNSHFLMIAPWPYADIYEELKPHIEDWDYSNYNLVNPVIKPVCMTREEVFKQVLQCYKKYYLQKLPQWEALKNEFKKHLLFKGLQAMVKNSFLRRHMSAMGGMPAEVEQILRGACPARSRRVYPERSRRTQHDKRGVDCDM